MGGLADAPRPGRPREVPRPRRGRGQGPGLRAARRQRDAAGPLDLPRAGPPGGRQRHRSRALGVHRAPLARRRRDQALAAPVVDLPPRPVLRRQGRPRPGPLPAGLGRTAARRREYVLSADEKPGVQARSRIHLPLPPGPRRAMRAESEYRRCGTLAYLAAYDVHRARVIGRCEPSTGIKPFTALVDQVMRPSRTPRRSGSSGSWTTGPRTATGPPPPG